MMAARWADIERSLASSRLHFTMAIEAFDAVKGASSDKERYFRRGSFMHAMLAGYTSFENAMKDLTGLLGEPLPAGYDWNRASRGSRRPSRDSARPCWTTSAW